MRPPVLIIVLLLAAFAAAPASASAGSACAGYQGSDGSACTQGYNDGFLCYPSNNTTYAPAPYAAGYNAGRSDAGGCYVGTGTSGSTGGGGGTTGGSGTTGGAGTTGGSGTTGGGTSTGGTGTTGGGTGTTGGGTTTAPCSSVAKSFYGGPTPCDYYAGSTVYHGATGLIWKVGLPLLLVMLAVWQGPRLIKMLLLKFGVDTDRNAMAAGNAERLEKRAARAEKSRQRKYDASEPSAAQDRKNWDDWYDGRESAGKSYDKTEDPSRGYQTRSSRPSYPKH